MSFMFNPYRYEDQSAVNRPELTAETVDSLVCGTKTVAERIVKDIEACFDHGYRNSPCLIGMDGYVSAQWEQTIRLVQQLAGVRSIEVEAIDIQSCYKSSQELEKSFQGNLPNDRIEDPVLLFGKLFHGAFEDLFDQKALQGLKVSLENRRDANSERKVVIVYGCGSAIQELRNLYHLVLYYDVTPKQTILRIKNGLVKNLGDDRARPYKELMRRCYYIDFEVVGRLRGELLDHDDVDYYVASDDPDNLQCVPKEAFRTICNALVQQPFRCKPVYLEGVWGGEFIRKLRKLPTEMKNCAWVFDLIPLEVSVLVAVGAQLVEIPYLTFCRKEGVPLMGEACVKKFHGFFPIRFNYDDTFHSNGNMSIQVHPTDDYIKQQNLEYGRQDESYYVVQTGHGAKTYLGMKDDADTDAFFKAIRASETELTPVDYDRYVNAVPSVPGTQFMIPAGTIHSSGRNQVVLEIGSLTVGSYTYKLYDYLRLDLDGKPRPIHSYHGQNVMQTNRTGSWVKNNLVQRPQLVRRGDGWSEWIVGEHDLIYFSLRRLEFDKEIECDTDGVFHVLTLVDGERTRVESKQYPHRCYEQEWLDIVVVPACVGKYVIRNLGNQPVCVHLTRLRDDFEERI